MGFFTDNPFGSRQALGPFNTGSCIRLALTFAVCCHDRLISVYSEFVIFAKSGRDRLGGQSLPIVLFAKRTRDYLASAISTRRFNSRACGLELSVIG